MLQTSIPERGYGALLQIPPPRRSRNPGFTLGCTHPLKILATPTVHVVRPSVCLSHAKISENKRNRLMVSWLLGTPIGIIMDLSIQNLLTGTLLRRTVEVTLMG